ncbi:hypothetical protein B0T14DRAFT_502689 [Immersiella caudata]|uniref:Uncharacterized protein n=1 Tax=Immersiella caudata TaxID=314043 RepID=A0AA39XDD4_9PEZI|nr:hypothetical protein B0T14DRAFT_502689 [Immersiella caudata]
MEAKPRCNCLHSHWLRQPSIRTLGPPVLASTMMTADTASPWHQQPSTPSKCRPTGCPTPESSTPCLIRMPNPQKEPIKFPKIPMRLRPFDHHWAQLSHQVCVDLQHAAGSSRLLTPNPPTPQPPQPNPQPSMSSFAGWCPSGPFPFPRRQAAVALVKTVSKRRDMYDASSPCVVQSSAVRAEWTIRSEIPIVRSFCHVLIPVPSDKPGTDRRICTPPKQGPDGNVQLGPEDAIHVLHPSQRMSSWR